MFINEKDGDFTSNYKLSWIDIAVWERFLDGKSKIAMSKFDR
jgi:hypothetical protein